MKMIPTSTIDLTITSPPYDNRRIYNNYTFNFNQIANELYRITKNAHTLVWIVADSTNNFCESMTSFKQALYFVQCGFKLLDTMIYLKKYVLPMYPSIKRYNSQFEYMFIFTKGKPIVFNPIRIPNASKGKPNHLSARYSNGSQQYKTIITADTKIIGNVWEYDIGYNHSTNDDIAYNHPAIFPESLAKDHILSWSNENDLVFDPMCGSGTTCKMAKLLNRNYLGCDISNEYVEIAKQRLANTSIVNLSKPSPPAMVNLK